MSHSHHHDHDHHHDHTHSHDTDSAGELTLAEKLTTLISHWIDHNDSHTDTYASWADKAEAEGMAAVARELRETTRLCSKITSALKEARKAVSKGTP